MNQARPILAATDFSAAARHAADRAARLAHTTGAPLALMHVLSGGGLQDLRRWLGGGSAVEQQLHADASQQLRHLADQLHATRHVPVRTVDASGVPTDEIVREADAIDAALLVLGSRGLGFLRRLVLGTTSERLLRRTTRPLLVVRQTPHEAYRRVLLALDFSAWSVPSLDVARWVAPHAHFVLLHVFDVPFEGKLRLAGVDADTIDFYRQQARAEATRKVHEFADAAGLKSGQWQPCIAEGEAWMRIVEQEQESDCDLVVLGKHGRSATEELLLGSVTQLVLAEGSADVLVSTRKEPGHPTPV
jgi:nucleotide-binding universal stress UspA family protein